MRPEILITKPMVPASVDALAAAFTIHDLTTAADPDALLAEVGPRIRGIAGGKVRAALMARLPALEIIANSGVGVDSIDMDVARARGIAVTNTPGVLDGAVAELTLGLMLALARDIPRADAFVRNGGWTGGTFPNGAELRGKTLGLIGLGRIGGRIATLASAFGMRILYHARNARPDQPHTHMPDLVQMARQSDWLVAIAPAGPATRGIVSAEVLAALGPQGRFVNVARGSLVDEPALITALQTRAIAGAALDVFENEPAIDPTFAALDNVVLSSHRGSHTGETRAAMDDMVVRNLLAHFAGQPLLSAVA
jgi:lactate dehydrogenase-like 2-hydroxyacid dehydrogenase